MYSRLSVVAALFLSGCVSAFAPPMPPHDGYTKVREVEGCCRKIEPRQFDVRLGSGLEHALRAQLAGRALETPQCWYEEAQDRIVLEAGNICEAYDEIHFAKIDGTWNLTEATRNELVSCHIRQQ